MKKFLTILLTLCMVATIGVTAFAEENQTTDITYNASENGGVDAATWTVTVPATLTAGKSGTIKVEGSWAPSDILSVTADKNVNMYLDGDENADYAVVPVIYNAISLAGSYTGAVSAAETVTVDPDNTMSAIKFGKWEGVLTFYISLAADPDYVSSNIGGKKVTVTNVAEINSAIAEAVGAGEQVTTVVLANDVTADAASISVPSGADVVFDMNGKTIEVSGNGTAATDRLFYTEAGSNLVITGNGTINFGDSISSIAVGGYGSITIENGTFIRNRYTNADDFYPLVENTKNADTGTKFVINGGYFDSGYYNLKDDGTPDCFNNCRQLLNSAWSNCDIVVYGGTFVGANPAWGDEGMTALCTVCGGNTYCQQVFLAGQDRTATELPAGYTITEGVLDDGRPTYTVSYVAPVE